MREEFRPAIEAMQRDLQDLEAKARETKKAINTLCTHAGVAPMYPDADQRSSASTVIRADTFYGKRISTAAREYLEMRKAMAQGPASPREIYEALIEGGFLFDTKDEQTALVSLRSTLRKNSATFHRLPNNQYGLLSWYEHVKSSKSDASDVDSSDESDESDESDDDSDDDSGEHPLRGTW